MIYESELLIPNQTDRVLSVWIEPWAIDWDIPSGSTGRFYANSSCVGEWERADDSGDIVIYGWSGSSLQIYIDDVLEFDSGDLRFPELASDVPTKKLVNTLFKPNTSSAMKKKWWQFW